MSESEELDRALDDLLGDRSPRETAPSLGPEEQRMLRMAQMLRGTADHPPDPQFVERLHGKVFRQPVRVSRRTAFLSGLGALAAGLAAGIGIDRSDRLAPSLAALPPLVDGNGRWFAVARVADLHEGAIRPFTAGAIQGFVINRGGQIRGLSRICTHMGCALSFRKSEQAFVCPCHGAEFDLRGKARYGPQKYGQPLAPLPEIKVRVRGQSIEVWGA